MRLRRGQQAHGEHGDIPALHVAAAEVKDGGSPVGDGLRVDTRCYLEQDVDDLIGGFHLVTGEVSQQAAEVAAQRHGGEFTVTQCLVGLAVSPHTVSPDVADGGVCCDVAQLADDVASRKTFNGTEEGMAERVG